jgi:transposase
MHTQDPWWSLEIPEITVGIDLADRKSDVCILNARAEVIERSRVSTTPEAIAARFQSVAPARIVLEVGTHSPWMSRQLQSYGHEVIVANPSLMNGGTRGKRKKRNDTLDAESLARRGRADPALLHPLRHRQEDTQADLVLLHSRDALVSARTPLINHVRGSVKALGARLPGCSAESFHRQARERIPEALRPALEPIVEMIHNLTRQIRAFDKQVEKTTQERYPEALHLQQIAGVGPLTSLAYVLVVEDPKRFSESRAVGAYVGLVPKLDETGGAGNGPELPITKAGNMLLRRLLVSAAHYILGHGPDTDLQRWGHGIVARGGGGKKARKRAAVAVARKLAVLLHRLWITGEAYEPLRNGGRDSSGGVAPAWLRSFGWLRLADSGLARMNGTTGHGSPPPQGRSECRIHHASPAEFVLCSLSAPRACYELLRTGNPHTASLFVGAGGPIRNGALANVKPRSLVGVRGKILEVRVSAGESAVRTRDTSS